MKQIKNKKAEITPALATAILLIIAAVIVLGTSYWLESIEVDKNKTNLNYNYNFSPEISDLLIKCNLIGIDEFDNSRLICFKESCLNDDYCKTDISYFKIILNKK